MKKTVSQSSRFNGGRIRNPTSPLTDHCPKPMLKLGDKPILELIIENFIEYGFYRFYISVNYHAEMIKNYFGDGAKWGQKFSI